jgi:hypothetical protein
MSRTNIPLYLLILRVKARTLRLKLQVTLCEIVNEVLHYIPVPSLLVSDVPVVPKYWKEFLTFLAEKGLDTEATAVDFFIGVVETGVAATGAATEEALAPPPPNSSTVRGVSPMKYIATYS